MRTKLMIAFAASACALSLPIETEARHKGALPLVGKAGCKPALNVSSGGQTRSGARESAIDEWRSAINRRYGFEWTSWRRAVHKRIRCRKMNLVVKQNGSSTPKFHCSVSAEACDY